MKSSWKKKKSKSLYELAADEIHKNIIENRYEQGTILPSELELSKRFNISRTTLRAAMAQLERQGIIVRRQGLGTMVLVSPPQQHLIPLHYLPHIGEFAKMLGSEAKITKRDAYKELPSSNVAAKFKIDEESQIFVCDFLYSLDGKPFAFFKYFERPDVMSWEIFSQNDESPLTILIGQEDPDLAFSNSEIYALNLDKRTASFLGVETGQAVIHMKENVYLGIDNLIGLSYNYYLTDRMGFSATRVVHNRYGE